VSTDTTAGDCDGAYTTVYTITATDASGNSASAARTVTVSDSTDPSFTARPGDEAMACDDQSPPESVAMVDGCDTRALLIEPQVVVTDNTEDNQVVEYTWTATDACGNSASHTATYTFSDTQAPSFEDSVSDVAASCDNVPDATSRPVGDTCDETVVTASSADSVEPGSCDDEYVITRTWTARDRSGNTATDEQKITVTDTEAPVWTREPRLSLSFECGDSTDDVYTANDACAHSDDVQVTMEETSDQADPEADGSIDWTFTLTRKWTATDRCGNSDSFTQKATVADTKSPVISAGPSDHSAECKHVPDIDLNDLVVADACDSAPTVECSESRRNGASSNDYELLRTCSATDRAGNAAARDWVVSVHDTTAPTVHGLPDDTTVEMGGSEEYADCAAVLALARGADNCDAAPKLSVADKSPSDNTACHALLVCEVTATDASGNKASATFTQTSLDTLGPVFDAYPDDDAVECDSIPTVCEVATVGEELEVSLARRETATGEIRTWTATDLCGHVEKHSQTLTVSDSSAPVFSRLPADEDVACDCDTLPYVTKLQAVDNCDDAVSIDESTVKIDVEFSGQYKLVHTWLASDSKGNTAEHQQTISVTDAEAPQITMNEPQTLEVACEARADLRDPIAFAADNCDEGDLGLALATTSSAGDCANEETITHTWTAHDDAGNQATLTQTVAITDNNPPVATARATSCLQKNGLWFAFGDWAALFGAEDACGGANVNLVSVNGQTGGGSLAGGWKLSGSELTLKADGVAKYEIVADAVDQCGNHAALTHVVSVVAGGEHCLVGDLDLDERA
jgi:hypothetical protein